jgi:hypothetical protein
MECANTTHDYYAIISAGYRRYSLPGNGACRKHVQVNAVCPRSNHLQQLDFYLPIKENDHAA